MLAALALRGANWNWARPYVLGVLNVTPDSFSDGGTALGTDDALRRATEMLDEGADGIDVGGESTRPGAAAVSASEELRRVLPVVSQLAARGVVVSVDTMKADVAEAALGAGASILNDVGMGDSAARLGRVAARFGAAVIVMHSRGTPETMRSCAKYDHVVAEVAAELTARADEYRQAGVPRGQIVLDPGIGFAKDASQSLAVLANVASIRAVGYAVCVGPSRKSFIDAADAYAPAWSVRARAPNARVGGTSAAVAHCVMHGVEIVRVHDVATMVEAARVAHAMRLRRAGGG